MRNDAMMPGIFERYRHFFPFFSKNDRIISLDEGTTPLIPAPAVAAATGLPGLRVYLKYEGLNPTGSFKDRGMTIAVSQARLAGANAIICASTGNTSASAAAYGARAGLTTYIIIPKGKVALGKLSQAILYGARIVEIDGNFDEALDVVRALGETGKVTVVNSINPYRIEGQKTAAFEICDALGDAPHYLFIPVGNAGNITAYWKGFGEYAAAGRARRLPKMVGYQAAGAAPIVLGHPVSQPETLATAIRIGNPASWQGAVDARDASGGWIESVTDEEIIAAYKMLASREGVFCEPASAASVAGLLKAAQQGQLAAAARHLCVVVCVLTGNGLKDPDTAIARGDAQSARLPADTAAIARYFQL